MNPAAMLKVVDIIAVASITNTSVSPETLKDSLPSSNEVRNSITPTMGRGNVVKMARRLDEKNRPRTTSITPYIKMAPPVLAPNKYWAARPPDPWQRGIPPMNGVTTFIVAMLAIKFRGVTSLRLGKRSWTRLMVATTALVNVRKS